MAAWDHDSTGSNRALVDDEISAVTDVGAKSAVSSSVARWTTNLRPMTSEFLVNQHADELDVDGDRVDVVFKKGANQLVFKHLNGIFDWKFSCRLLESK